MAILVTASANHTLDALLELVCVRLQLTATQDAATRVHYRAVSNHLSRPGTPVAEFEPHIFGQGSQQLGTTVKPRAQAEFDLDLVCRCNLHPAGHPGTLYRLLWDRMWASDVYRPMMRRLPRCIRLDYSGDFHLDIVPAVPDASRGGTHILVPDLDANLALDHPKNDRWKVANPQGFCGWFEGQCVHPVLLEKYARAQVDPLPEREHVHEKPALKRSTQLFKRWRDVHFKDEPEFAPPSIILTTLSGLLYGGEMLCTDALDTILNGVIEWIESGRAMCLRNPAHDGETICEKWEKSPTSYRAFETAVRDFHARWERLLAARGIHEIEAQLTELFEEAPVQWAVKEMARGQVIRPRDNGTLRVAPTAGAMAASIASASLPIRPNTFFGDGELAT
jgi:hypothetical protein